MENEKKNKIKGLSFEEALKDLENIVEELDSGDLELEKAIKAYEYGIVLKKHCEKRLVDAKARIDKITVDDNEIQIKPLNEN